MNNDNIILETTPDAVMKDNSLNLENEIINANDNEVIMIKPGTYYLNNITLTKNITLQGNGNTNDIIIDGQKKSSIFLIRNDNVYATFRNITFINANTTGFGGAISMETGQVYVDNCNFINNTAGVNAGGISNYGTEGQKGYLFVNNSLFINNHAGHDGGAVTTCFASSDIYNCVFVNNSAHRDGGAIRVSVEGYGNVQNCIFMYNHADEWGGAYYSWSGESNIVKCIFMNNTAGTNGGAVMVSGNLNLEQSIIVNNTGSETGGSFYIQQPMYDAATVINVHNNLITNNSSPYGKEIFINWNDTKHLFTKFNYNDWGDEDPNDSDVIDPDHVTTRSAVTATIKSNLLNELNLNLLNRYSDLLKNHFPKNYFGDDDEDNGEGNSNTPTDNNKQASSNESSLNLNQNNNEKKDIENQLNNNQKSDIANKSTTNQNPVTNATIQNQLQSIENNIQINGSSNVGTDSEDVSKASEIIEHSPSKNIQSINIGIILFVIVAIIAFLIGYKREKGM